MCRFSGIYFSEPVSLDPYVTSIAEHSKLHAHGNGSVVLGENGFLTHRSTDAAYLDPDFMALGKLKARRAGFWVRHLSDGPIDLRHTQPFHHEGDAFPKFFHNGSVPRRKELPLRDLVDPEFWVEGANDSRIYYGLFLTHLKRENALPDPTFQQSVRALARARRDIQTAAFYKDARPEEVQVDAEARSRSVLLPAERYYVAAEGRVVPALNALVVHRDYLIAARDGRTLYAAAGTASGKVESVEDGLAVSWAVFASQPAASARHSVNQYLEVPEGSWVGVDDRSALRTGSLDTAAADQSPGSMAASAGVLRAAAQA
ncbi:MAG TPA: hypothetical protein VEY30_01005 [Myxococcaceae bacterium]|nr:hypothetical protein [Myxococcaceae bacterium]